MTSQRIKRQQAKLGWKVVCITKDGKRQSSSPWARLAAISYFLRKWVGPLSGHGPIAVFKTRRQAREFCRNLSEFQGGRTSFKTYRCKYVPSKHVTQWTRWNKNRTHRLLPEDMPAGKALADEVMLLYKDG
jgi:hypothetical protein